MFDCFFTLEYGWILVIVILVLLWLGVKLVARFTGINTSRIEEELEDEIGDNLQDRRQRRDDYFKGGLVVVAAAMLLSSCSALQTNAREVVEALRGGDDSVHVDVSGTVHVHIHTDCDSVRRVPVPGSVPDSAKVLPR